MMLPEATVSPPDRTASWLPREAPPSGPADDTGGFTPRQVIAPPTGRHTISEPTDLVRARLRVLPIIHILILAGVFILKRAVFGLVDPMVERPYVTVMLALVGLVVLLWSRWPIPLAGLKALELGMVGLLAGLYVLLLYRVMLESSVRGDLLRSQLALKNIVLMTAVLILTYGLYVPA